MKYNVSPMIIDKNCIRGCSNKTFLRWASVLKNVSHKYLRIVRFLNSTSFEQSLAIILIFWSCQDFSTVLSFQQNFWIFYATLKLIEFSVTLWCNDVNWTAKLRTKISNNSMQRKSRDDFFVVQRYEKFYFQLSELERQKISAKSKLPCLHFLCDVSPETWKIYFKVASFGDIKGNFC